MRSVLLADMIIEKCQGKPQKGLQKQIYKIIHNAIYDGVLREGYCLPSTRSLSQDLGVSRTTISLVYEHLITEGFLISKSGSGTFVASGVQGVKNKDLVSELVQWPYSQRGNQILQRQPTPHQPKGAFVPGVPDLDLFPFHLWSRIVAKYYSRQYRSLNGYASQGGYAPLRKAIASYLAVSRSVHCDPSQVFITHGTSQSLDLCARMLSDAGAYAYLENPVHGAISSVFYANDIKVKGIALDQEGMNLKYPHIEQDEGGFIYVTPSVQYPTCITMSAKRREHILTIAKEKSLWVFEDDYDSEFQLAENRLPSLYQMDQHNRVIYFGTFSKSMFSGLRLSYMIVPLPMVKAFGHAMTNLYLPGMLPLQAAMAEFIEEGHFYRHLKKMRLEYAKRGDLLRQSLEKTFGSTISLSKEQAGLHLMARFTVKADIAKILALASDKGLVLRPAHYLPQTEAQPIDEITLVLGFGGIELNKIEDAVTALYEIFEQLNALPEQRLDH